MTLFAGCRELTVHDPVQQVRLPAWLLYPTETPSRLRSFGPYQVDLSPDAPFAPGEAPLVVVSHGGGGSPWVYRDLAARLAREGYAVALPEHLGNSRSDNSLADAEVNLQNRPRHVRLVIDAALAEPSVQGERVAVIGHSIGGYTALASAGGRPMTLPAHIPIERRADPDPETARLAYPIPVEADPRVAAVALLAPAIGWFLPEGALADVRAPVFVRTAAHDPLCPTPQISRALRSLSPGVRLDLAEVAGAGHFSFSSPFPPAMAHPGFAPAHDPPGFDRAAYQQVLQGEILAFLLGAVGAPSAPRR